MTYVVNETCIKCKLMDCVEVCPVDCFYEGENMLVIHPDECIDCGTCAPECPVDAINPDTEPGLEKWLSSTRITPSYGLILRSRRNLRLMPEWRGVPDKGQYFSPNPGDGT
jgi:ferredoxin